MANAVEERVHRDPGHARSVSATLGIPSRLEWLTTFRRILMIADLAVVGASTFLATALRFGSGSESVDGLRDRTALPDVTSSYTVLSLVLTAGWLLFLSLQASRDRRIIGVGPDEYKRVVTASVQAFALVAIACYLSRTEISRFYTATAFTVGTLGLLLSRWLLRKWLHRRRISGGWSHRVLVVGDRQHVIDLSDQLRREFYAGLRVVGVCLPGGHDDGLLDEHQLTVVGSLTSVPEAAAAVEADTIAVVPSPGMTAVVLRRLGWALEGTGVDLVVAPALTDVAGPRVHVRPVAGIPLLHVEAPEYEGPMRVVKGAFEFVFAALLLLLLSLPMLSIAVAIKASSRGPALFRQERVGRGGRSFTLYKFRSMVIDAEHLLAAVVERNEHDGVLFKMRVDPRVTRVGRFIRRYSLDELPQLFNVLLGSMSLVGPRPPLPSEVAQYGFDVRRRLLVKPGVTGLWQVSGRSDLTWEDSVRLDLYYVENWSMTGDIVILWKTLAAVLSGRGAY